MALDSVELSRKMYRFYQEVLIGMQVGDLSTLKDQIAQKKTLLKAYRNQMISFGSGRQLEKFSGELDTLLVEYETFLANFNDKLMIFIIGDGNVGKSTLLNSFVGYEAAKTSFLPLTWKIDVFDPGQEKDALLKFNNGTEKTMSVLKVKKFIEEEEKKTSTAKKEYNERLKKEIGPYKTREEIEEYKKYYGEKYLYVSPVTEVRWPVTNNWILDQCLLVDTPGLNQYLNEEKQLGSLTDYYHKADGIIWLLDGNTIASSNPKTALEKLDSHLAQVGGLRDNMIGVVNKIDLIERNGGKEAVEKVLADAKKIYRGKFHSIIGVSSKIAFEGVEKNSDLLMEKSGIISLQETIKDVFISKSQDVKNSAKVQGNLRLKTMIVEEIGLFLKESQKIREKHKLITRKLEPMRMDLSAEIQEDIQAFLDQYLEETKLRIHANVDSLAEGKKESFIRETMYQSTILEQLWIKLLQKQWQNIHRNVEEWRKFSVISEYTYISRNNYLAVKAVAGSNMIKGVSLKEIKYFSPKFGDNLFDIVGNFFGKIAFSFRRSGIISKIYEEIRSTFVVMRESAMKDFNEALSNDEKKCRMILDRSYAETLFPVEKHDRMVSFSEEFSIKFMEEKMPETTLIDVLKENGSVKKSDNLLLYRAKGDRG